MERFLFQTIQLPVQSQDQHTATPHTHTHKHTEHLKHCIEITRDHR